MKQINNKITVDVTTKEDLVNVIQKLDEEFELAHINFLLDTLTKIKGKKYSLKNKNFKIISNPANKFIKDWTFADNNAKFNRILHLFIDGQEQFSYIYTIIFNMKLKEWFTDRDKNTVQFAQCEVTYEFNYLTRLKIKGGY